MNMDPKPLAPRPPSRLRLPDPARLAPLSRAAVRWVSDPRRLLPALTVGGLTVGVPLALARSHLLERVAARLARRRRGQTRVPEGRSARWVVVTRTVSVMQRWRA